MGREEALFAIIYSADVWEAARGGSLLICRFWQEYISVKFKNLSFLFQKVCNDRFHFRKEKVEIENIL